MKNLKEAPQYEIAKQRFIEAFSEFDKKQVREYDDYLSISVEGLGGVSLRFNEKHTLYVASVAKNTDVPNRQGAKMLQENLDSFMRAWNTEVEWYPENGLTIEVQSPVWIEYLDRN